jgi:S-DNA-T family DNA segregation ATPase FtsK/SpoIIIE
MVNLAELPHLLIGGSTGSGKSSCAIHSIVTSILMRSTPEQVKMILVDPKRLELSPYNGLPHLITPVVVDPGRAVNALAWAVKEMERRYDLLAMFRKRDINGYNEALPSGNTASGEFDVDPQSPEALPFILIVVDEMSELLANARSEVEDSVERITRAARAVGIHLVLASSKWMRHPSRDDSMTGRIKANIPSRISFKVPSAADSTVTLDQPGAERLEGNGDMLFRTTESHVLLRLQAPWVSEWDVRKVVAHWQAQG